MPSVAVAVHCGAVLPVHSVTWNNNLPQLNLTTYMHELINYDNNSYYKMLWYVYTCWQLPYFITTVKETT